MNKVLHKYRIIQIIIAAALIAGIAAFISRPSDTYAGGAFSEVPYAVKSAVYSASSKCAKVTVKWSKAYSRSEDGAISAASGYEIQYAKNASFKGAKTVRKGKKASSALIKLKDLKTRRKYNKYISRYYFRIRSYTTVDGVKVYSEWANAAQAKAVKVYSPVTLGSIAADRNTVTASWDRVAGAQGYIVYGKKAGAAKWKKKLTIKDPSEVEYKEEGLEYSCDYTYSVIAYRKQTAQDPSVLNTSCLKLLADTKNNVYRIKTDEYSVEVPAVRAVFRRKVLNITWHSSEGAEDYQIQWSKDKGFDDPDATGSVDFTKDMLLGDMNSYTMQRDDVDQENYYVRARAKGAYKGAPFESEWSEPVLAEFGAGTYQINFDGNMATGGSMDSSVVVEGEEYTLPENKFKRDGYKFIGWCRKDNNGLYIDAELPIQYGMPDYNDASTVKDLAEADDDVTLYACWQGTGPEAAADWAVTIAYDDEFCYGPKVKNHCWFCKGGNKFYICNALVAAAYTHGMPYFSGYRSGSTDWSWWLKNGFSDVGENVPAEEIRKGDVICCWNGSRWGHIMIAATDGNIKNPTVVHAAGRGSDGTGTAPSTIREESMAKQLAKRSAGGLRYHVVRFKTEG